MSSEKKIDRGEKTDSTKREEAFACGTLLFNSLFGFLGVVEFFVGVWVFSAKKVLFDVFY
tara:strand:- start:5500 stop:5679 length:180 start_codon:yes stop_codon:yes gene_type:complete